MVVKDEGMQIPFSAVFVFSGLLSHIVWSTLSANHPNET
jgi:hypothetical protein